MILKNLQLPPHWGHLNMLNLRSYFVVFLTGVMTFTCTSTLLAQDAATLFASLQEEEAVEIPLLPERMLFTQRLLWGKKGLFRTTNIAPLTKAQREKELRLRRKLLITHQAIGYLTLAGMVAQGILGGQLYNGKYELYETHKTLGNIVTATYFTGAGLSLFSPPPLVNKKIKGWSSSKAHKVLATVHLSAMIATNILADKDRKLHRVAAYTAFGSFALAVVVFKF